MTITPTSDPTPRKPLRLWPGVVLAIVLVVARYVVPVIAPEAMVFELSLALLGFFGGILCAFAIIVWWVFFSRAPWSERVGAIVLMIVALAGTYRIVHPSIAGGNMGMMLPIYAIPVLSLALVAGAVASRRLATGPRRASMVASILLACGVFTIIRTGGVMGAGADLHWRWTPTPEERLLAQGHDEPAPPAPAAAPAAAETPTTPLPEKGSNAAAASAPTVAKPPDKGSAAAEAAAADPIVPRKAEWPGFRGPARDSVVRGVRIDTDWAKSPPVELWRRPIGPGWSSFAVPGDLVYTQEQRGGDEMVSCYRLTTGEPVWRHRDGVRFWESNAGAGPRGTPTLHNGRVYALGATGVLNALDADTGAVVWTRNAATDTGVTVPDWGVASSPLVIGDVVIVAVSGRLIAYDVRTGQQRWVGPEGGAGYSSPHLMTIDGVEQVLLLRGSRTISVAPATGALLWEHTWVPGAGIVQPAQAPNGDVLISNADAMGGLGMRRLAVDHGPSGWTVQDRWSSRALKPYFNDFVVHAGHAFGFDGSILASVDLENGERKWKGGRYGQGQMVLLPDQDLLLVVSEDGELALVAATPDKFTELARFPALEGKTWNHPALVGDVLLVRNGEEMVAFRLSLAGPRGLE